MENIWKNPKEELPKKSRWCCILYKDTKSVISPLFFNGDEFVDDDDIGSIYKTREVSAWCYEGDLKKQIKGSMKK